ncbi:permease-like cell division protein FtsX [Candidatus Woesearchaeota archaeon]|nr:permease-like cell division protein FtsX [Candidatus Woesearchaeota archaeon]
MTLLIRIIKSGWMDFKRNSGLSVAAIFIMVLAISMATSLFLFRESSQILTKNIEEKLDMYVYFNDELSSDEILAIQKELSGVSGIKDVVYISKDEALQKFVLKHRDDQSIMESLRELGKNPLLSSINIQAWEASQYAAISNFLINSDFSSLISKIDYQQKKPAIERLASISSGINNAGIIANIILALAAILVAFNTVRLAIYNSREEIETMRLVGASNNFIRGPFLVQGVIVGFLSAVIALLIFGVGLLFLNSGLKLLLSGFNLFGYFISNLPVIFLTQLAFGIGLGVISSQLAIRKYLRA